MRGDIGKLYYDLLSKEDNILALDLAESERIENFWLDKVRVAQAHANKNKEKSDKIRAKISEALKDSDIILETGCNQCGLSKGNTDLCDWCYKISEGLN